MAAKKLTVVISQGQGKNPARRNLEEDIAAALIMDPEVNVSLVPHLYDMARDHSGMLFLRSAPGDLVVLSWLYPRAARWILDRNGVSGREGITLLKEEDADDEEEMADVVARHGDEAESNGHAGNGHAGNGHAANGHGGGLPILGQGPAGKGPQRRIWCIDLRVAAGAKPFLDEVRRIGHETSVQTVDLMGWIQGSPKPQQLERYLHPERMLAAAKTAPASDAGDVTAPTGGAVALSPDLPEPTKRRWYPVIDYSRCTNCMECLDFCLFGVYGVDSLDKILVEQQDNCKKGCPACSRVCPANAIIFPGHKTAAIAGADGEVAGLKIDLSALFGAPSAIETAALERDAELVADGREAVGLTVGIPKRQVACGSKPKDALDSLMDGLDALDL